MLVVFDFQFYFVVSDFFWVIDCFGKDWMNIVFVWKMLMFKGILCVGGLDVLIEFVDFFFGIQFVVFWKSSYEQNGLSYNESECLIVYEVIKFYIEGSVGIIYKEKLCGKIVEGYDVDFMVFSVDLFIIDFVKFYFLDIEKIVINGQVVYEKL